LENYLQKDKWIGCFGCLSIINTNFLIDFDEKTSIINIMLKMDTNRKRRAIESLFSLICRYYVEDDITSYDGLYYDGLNLS